MSRLFTPEIAEYYEKYYQDKGIKLMKGELASGFVDAGDGTVKAVELKSGGTIPADLVIVGAGAKPNTEMFDGQLELLKDKPGGVKVMLMNSLELAFLQLEQSSPASRQKDGTVQSVYKDTIWPQSNFCRDHYVVVWRTMFRHMHHCPKQACFKSDSCNIHRCHQ